MLQSTQKEIEEQKSRRNEVLAAYAKNEPVIGQLVDLALLQNNLLKGASLDAFVKRSVDLMK